MTKRRIEDDRNHLNPTSNGRPPPLSAPCGSIRLFDQLYDLAIEEKREELAAKEAEIEDCDADVEEKREEKEALDDKLEELRSKRSKLEDVRYDLETERGSLESIRSEKHEAESALEELPEAPIGEVEELETELD